MSLFIRAVNGYNSLGKRPVSYGTPYEFHHSERHMIDAFGDHQGKNVTELAELLGVTKGAISQVLAKLERKNAVRRYKLPGDDKATFVSLTGTGRRIYEAHRKINIETVRRVRRRFRGGQWVRRYALGTGDTETGKNRHMPDGQTIGLRKFHKPLSKVTVFFLRSDRSACIRQIKSFGIDGHASGTVLNMMHTLF